MLYTYVYMYITCTFISVTAMTEYGWRRENRKLEIDWEVQENREKAKMSLDFVLKGCKCKTGCKTRICSCRKKERQCGPSCYCQFCNNRDTNGTHAQMKLISLYRLGIHQNPAAKVH